MLFAIDVFGLHDKPGVALILDLLRRSLVMTSKSWTSLDYDCCNLEKITVYLLKSGLLFPIDVFGLYDRPGVASIQTLTWFEIFFKEKFTMQFNVHIKSRHTVGKSGESSEWQGLKQNWSRLSSLFDGMSQKHPWNWKGTLYSGLSLSLSLGPPN